MLHRTAALVAIAVLSLLSFASGAAPVGAASGWSPTATSATPLLNATPGGALSSSTPISVTLGLQTRNGAALQEFLHSVNEPSNPLYGQYLTPAQFLADYGATNDQVNAVTSYLTQQGFTNIKVAANHLLVSASGTVGQAESAFNTSIGLFKQNGATVYANTTAAQIPSSLSGIVLSVIGLNGAAHMSPLARAAQSVPNYPASYWAPGFWQAYDAGKTSTGSLTNIAIMAEGNVTQVVTDLRAYENDPNNAVNGVKLAQVPVSVVQVGPASIDTAASDEWDLDTQTSTGMADGVHHLYIYDAYSLSDPSITQEFNQFVTDNVAKAGSASFGECEYQAYLDGSMQTDDIILSEADAQGQTLFASAGDSGGFCSVGVPNGVPAGAPFVNYPASSVYVVAVGGTTLITNPDGSYNNELAWTAGGGGPSQFEFQPSWQNGIVPPASTTCAAYVLTCTGKELPDIAMDADPNSGANVYVNGQVSAIGGTSLASPLSLGVWARLESSTGNSLGFAPPILYASYKKFPFPQTAAVPTSATGYHDIIAGNTGPYEAAPGWDYATGLGSFDITEADTILPPLATPKPMLPPTLPPPACTVASDGSVGDATPLGSTSSNDALDIQAVGFYTATDTSGAQDLVAQMQVVSLNDGPAGTPETSGTGDYWYVTWTYSGTEYFLEANYPGTSPDPNNTTILDSFNYGTVTKSPTGGTLYNTVGAATGTLNLAKSIVQIQAPLSDLGSPPDKDSLTQTGGITFESIGTPEGSLLETADAIGPGATYVVGQTCAISSPTVARLVHLGIHRHGDSVTFHWKMSASSGVTGFALYAAGHRLNARLIRAHSGTVYHFRTRWTGSARYTLRGVLANGHQVVLATG